MSRQLLVKIHLYLATFLTPVIIMMAISGGLYLFGFKGSSESTVVYEGNSSEIDFQSATAKEDVMALFEKAGIEADFEYVKGNTSILFTRPTSRDHHVLRKKDDKLTISLEQPDLVKSLIELHKGHGPGLFKTLQKVTAFGLTFILLSGLWIALVTPPLRKTALTITGSGVLVCIFIIMF